MYRSRALRAVFYKVSPRWAARCGFGRAHIYHFVVYYLLSAAVLVTLVTSVYLSRAGGTGVGGGKALAVLTAVDVVAYRLGARWRG